MAADIAANAPKGVIAQVLRTDFKNDFIWFLYQNSLYKKGVYNGYSLKPSNTMAGNFVLDEENKTVSYGPDILTTDMANKELGLSQIRHLFSNLDQYVRFKIEFERLNNTPVEELRKKYYYLDYLDRPITDLYLKQKIALYESMNHNAYFYGPTSVANVLIK